MKSLIYSNKYDGIFGNKLKNVCTKKRKTFLEDEK